MSGSSVVPSADEVKQAVFELLGEVDCETITRKELTRDLESKHEWDLSSLKAVVKESLTDFFAQATQDKDGEVESGDDGVENDEEDKPKKKGGGFTQPCQLAPELSDFLGCDIMPRTEVVKKIWEYIKQNELQNPNDRREILCDVELYALFKRKKVTMFSMNKLLSPMIKSVSELQDGVKREPIKKKKKTVSSKGSSSSSKPKKADADSKKKTMPKKLAAKKKKDRSNDNNEVKEKSPNPKAFGGPVRLASPLRKFLGEDELLRTDVTKLMWVYIKENSLQNPDNRKEIICDSKLKNLFSVDSFTMFEMAKLLKPMLLKLETTE